MDTDRFTPDPAARAEMRSRYGLGDRPVIVCLSRLVPRKGQDMLIRALPAIRERVDGAALVIVGGGPYLATLHRLAREAGVSEHVVFTGGVPGAELPAHHAMADVFAMPCRTRGAGLDVEGLGIVYLEASSTGVPVVAGDSGGAPETVQDGVTGRVVERSGRRRNRRSRRRHTRRPEARGRDGRRRAPLGRQQLAVAQPGRAAAEPADRLSLRAGTPPLPP